MLFITLLNGTWNFGFTTSLRLLKTGKKKRARIFLMLIGYNISKAIVAPNYQWSFFAPFN